ncbi:unnamed protein product [Lampetra fluviatilis]
MESELPLATRAATATASNPGAPRARPSRARVSAFVARQEAAAPSRNRAGDGAALCRRQGRGGRSGYARSAAIPPGHCPRETRGVHPAGRDRVRGWCAGFVCGVRVRVTERASNVPRAPGEPSERHRGCGGGGGISGVGGV